MELHRGLTPVGTKTSVALGYFDGVHRGHTEILRQTVNYANKMVLKPAVFTFDFGDMRPAEKGAKDLLPKDEKYSIFESLGVELCVEADFGELRNLSGREFIEGVLGHGCLNAAVVGCGEDFRFGKGRDGDVAAMQRLAGPLGIQINVVPFVIDDGVISTTRIKRLMAAGDISAAARLLGRNYVISADVTDANGQKKHVTFSQKLDENLEWPMPGVYASRVLLNDGFIDAVTYIGQRPTLGGNGIYADTAVLTPEGQDKLPRPGERVQLELLRLMRAEEKFESISELWETIEADIRRAKMCI